MIIPGGPFHNQYGLRHGRPDNLRPSVICFGDSISYGLRIPPARCWTELLTASRPERFLNAGCPGLGVNGIGQHWSEIQGHHHASGFILQIPFFDRRPAPDAAIEDGVNDFTFLNGVSKAYMHGALDCDLVLLARDLIRDELLDLQALVQNLSNEAPVTAWIMPYTSKVIHEFDELGSEYYREARDLMLLLGIPCVDIGDFMRPWGTVRSLDNSTPKQIILPEPDFHLSEDGHRFLAELIAPIVRVSGLGFLEL